MIFSNYQKEQIKEMHTTADIERDTTALIKKWLVYNEHLRGIFKQCATDKSVQQNGFNIIDFQALNEDIKKLL